MIDHSISVEIKNDDITLTNVTGSMVSMMTDVKPATTTTSDELVKASTSTRHNDEIGIGGMEKKSSEAEDAIFESKRSLKVNSSMRRSTWSPDWEQEIHKDGETVTFDLSSRKMNNKDDTLSLKTALEVSKSSESLDNKAHKEQKEDKGDPFKITK